jgi:hypothetical protein
MKTASVKSSSTKPSPNAAASRSDFLTISPASTSIGMTFRLAGTETLDRETALEKA